MRNIICCILGHDIPEGYTKFEHLGCTEWDDCDIKEHQMAKMSFKCNRCSFVKEKVVKEYQLHPETKLK